jgi:peptide/nickel transport system substrate-binding protein
MELLTYYSDQLSTDVLATFQQMLSQVGIEVKPRAVDVPTYNQLRDSSTFTLIYAGAGNGPDPDKVQPFFTTNGSSIAKAYGMNNPDLDKLFTQGQQESDPAKRAPIYQNICKILNDTLPWGPMWVSTRYGAVSKKVGNFIWTPAPGGGPYYDAAETWTFSK